VSAPVAYTCPKCRSVIPLGDINVAQDMALCRRCGAATPFSVLCGMAEIPAVSLDAPPKGVRVSQDFRGETKITYRRTSKAVFFLVPFTLLWSGMSLGGIYGEQILRGRFDPEQSLFGLPFLIGTVILLSILAYCLFGSWKIRLSQGTGTVFTGIGPLGWTRNFSFSRDSLVTLQPGSVKINNVTQKVICIKSSGDDFLFGATIQDDAKHFIAAVINSRIARG
jgi:hypothetical protein